MDAAATALLALGSCSDSLDQALGTCVGKEARAFSALATLAERTMQGVPHSLTEYKSCELDGVFDPAVITDVPDWHQPSDAKKHLTEPSLDEGELTTYRSPGGGFEASLVIESHNNTVISAHVYFQKVDA